jgi:hypothetical protein
MRKLLGFLILLSCFAGVCSAQNWQLPADRKIPWKTGSDIWNGGTLPNYTRVLCAGIVQDGVTDNTTTIQNCINALGPNQAALLPSTANTCSGGGIFFNGTIRVKSNTVLAGTQSGGVNVTVLCQGSGGSLNSQNWSHSVQLNPGINSGTIQTTFFLAGSPQKGDTQITTSTGTVAVGQYIKIIGNDDPTIINQLGNCTRSTPNSTCAGVTNACNYCADGDNLGNYFRQQIVKIVSFASGTGGPGTVLNLSQPLYYTPYTTSIAGSGGTQPAGAKYVIQTFLTFQAGFENFHLVGAQNNSGSSMIYLQGCLFCWVKGVETQMDNSGGDHAHIRVEWSYGTEIRDNYVHESRDNSGSNGYGIFFFQINGDNKVENNIIRHSRHPIIWEGGGDGGSAILYNYVDDAYTDDLTYLGSMRPNHGSHPYMMLLEGNIFSHVAEDNQHGSSSDHVYFRNNLWGDETDDNGGCSINSGNGINPAAPTCGPIPSFNAANIAGFAAIDVFSDNTRMTYAANVLGRTGMHVNWAAATLSADSQDCCIGRNTNPYVYAVATVGYTNGSVAAPSSSIIRQGNYDFFTNNPIGGVAFYDSGLPHTFDASIYYPSKPAFVGSKPWPMMGPDVTGGNLSGTSGTVNTNPAYDCYWTGGLHANQPFAPGTCYSSAPTAPAVSLTPKPLSFPNQPQNTPSTPGVITLQNTGSATLNISSITITTGTYFSISSNTCGSTLAISATCTISVVFKPTVLGALTDTLNVVTNASTSPDTVTLNGNGVIPTAPAVQMSYINQGKSILSGKVIQ